MARSTVTRPCDSCGKTLTINFNTNPRQRFCNYDCAYKARRGTPEQFWARVNKTENCWLWTGGKNKGGYGVATVDRLRDRAHRLAWRMAHGPVPKGLDVCHTCDNPPCVRPDHLFLGTRKQNMQDMSCKNRSGVHTKPERFAECYIKRRGEGGTLARLTEAQVLEIRSKYKLGRGTVTHKSLALEYGISPGGIGSIITRRTWKHV